MPNFHGVLTRRTVSGAVAVVSAASAITAIAVLAPIHLLPTEDQRLNEIVLINSDVDAAKYAGPDISGFTARRDLTGFFDHGGSGVMIVNVFDPAVHKNSIAAEVLQLAGDTARAAQAGCYGQVVTSSDSATTYVEGVDYTWDVASGTLTRLPGGAIAADASLSVSYDYADPSQVTAADIIGTVDADGLRTGLQAFENAQALFGFTPKIWIAPGFSSVATVAAELISKAELTPGAYAYIDAPLGTTVNAALAARNTPGMALALASKSADLCVGYARVADPAGGTRLEPLSVRAAALRGFVDRSPAFGFSASTSNKNLLGVVGSEFPTTGPEQQLLNDAGICTIKHGFGGGFVYWGNRSSAFPADTSVESFSNVNRTFRLVDSDIDNVTQQFVDRKITPALISTIVNTVTGFIDRLISEGHLITGSNVWFDPAKNPPAQLAAGILIISRRYMAFTPAGTIVHEAQADIRLFANVAIAA